MPGIIKERLFTPGPTPLLLEAQLRALTMTLHTIHASLAYVSGFVALGIRGMARLNSLVPVAVKTRAHLQDLLVLLQKCDLESMVA